MTAQLRNIRPSDARDLRTALEVLGGRAPEVGRDLREELVACETHIEAVYAFKQRMSWGNALSEHPTDVLTWLIQQGWTPPSGVYLLEDDKAEVIQELLDDLDQLPDPPAGDPS